MVGASQHKPNQPNAGPNDESDCVPSEGPVGIIDGSGDEREDGDGGAHDDRPPPVVTEEAAPETGGAAGSSSTPTIPKAKGKCGGKGNYTMDLKDPPLDNEANGHVQGFCFNVAEKMSCPFYKKAG